MFLSYHCFSKEQIQIKKQKLLGSNTIIVGMLLYGFLVYLIYDIFDYFSINNWKFFIILFLLNVLMIIYIIFKEKNINNINLFHSFFYLSEPRLKFSKLSNAQDHFDEVNKEVEVFKKEKEGEYTKYLNNVSKISYNAQKNINNNSLDTEAGFSIVQSQLQDLDNKNKNINNMQNTIINLKKSLYDRVYDQKNQNENTFNEIQTTIDKLKSFYQIQKNFFDQLDKNIITNENDINKNQEFIEANENHQLPLAIEENKQKIDQLLKEIAKIQDNTIQNNNQLDSINLAIQEQKESIEKNNNTLNSQITIAENSLTQYNNSINLLTQNHTKNSQQITADNNQGEDNLSILQQKHEINKELQGQITEITTDNNKIINEIDNTINKTTPILEYFIKNQTKENYNNSQDLSPLLTPKETFYIQDDYEYLLFNYDGINFSQDAEQVHKEIINYLNEDFINYIYSDIIDNILKTLWTSYLSTNASTYNLKTHIHDFKTLALSGSNEEQIKKNVNFQLVNDLINCPLIDEIIEKCSYQTLFNNPNEHISEITLDPFKQAKLKYLFREIEALIYQSHNVYYPTNYHDQDNAINITQDEWEFGFSNYFSSNKSELNNIYIRLKNIGYHDSLKDPRGYKTIPLMQLDQQLVKFIKSAYSLGVICEKSALDYKIALEIQEKLYEKIKKIDNLIIEENNKIYYNTSNENITSINKNQNIEALNRAKSCFQGILGVLKAKYFQIEEINFKTHGLLHWSYTENNVKKIYIPKGLKAPYYCQYLIKTAKIFSQIRKYIRFALTYYN